MVGPFCRRGNLPKRHLLAAKILPARPLRNKEFRFYAKKRQTCRLTPHSSSPIRHPNGNSFPPCTTCHPKNFPPIGNIFSNHWKNRPGFSNHWKKIFQSLENSKTEKQLKQLKNNFKQCVSSLSILSPFVPFVFKKVVSSCFESCL